jgi:uncharacterized protein (DUF2147 family)
MGLACLVALVLLLPALPGRAAEPDALVGRWLTQDKTAVIAVEPCGSMLCGRIVGISFDHPDDPVPTDNEGRSQCGLIIIRGGVPDGEQGWNIRITDPRNGKVYRASMRLDEQRRLRVRGYIGVPLLGHTEVWTPFRAAIGENCRMPAL